MRCVSGMFRSKDLVMLQMRGTTDWDLLGLQPLLLGGSTRWALFLSLYSPLFLSLSPLQRLSITDTSLV